MVDASLRATILDSLRQLNREFGISLIYITHDLTTAYQISENIIVLYRGAVAEAGDVDLVVKQPKHPYTQLLINSVPEPDPNHAWGSVDVAEAAEPTNGAATVVVSHVAAARQHGGHLIQGCTFADRCPHVMDMCRQTAPPLFHIDPGRAASCFLYREQGPALSSELLNDVMAAAGSSTRSESRPPTA